VGRKEMRMRFVQRNEFHLAEASVRHLDYIAWLGEQRCRISCRGYLERMQSMIRQRDTKSRRLSKDDQKLEPRFESCPMLSCLCFVFHSVALRKQKSGVDVTLFGRGPAA
jgi:hypothetical protein